VELMTAEERLGQIAAMLIREHGIYPPYTLVINDGQGQSVDLNVTMQIGDIHREGDQVEIEINVGP
jgi:hypothetical protein